MDDRLPGISGEAVNMGFSPMGDECGKFGSVKSFHFRGQGYSDLGAAEA